MATMKLISFRFSDHEIEQLDELLALVVDADLRDGFTFNRHTRTSVVKVSLATMLVQMKNARDAMKDRKLVELPDLADEPRPATKKATPAKKRSR